jgi:hypothetical protein
MTRPGEVGAVRQCCRTASVSRSLRDLRAGFACHQEALVRAGLRVDSGPKRYDQACCCTRLSRQRRRPFLRAELP